MPNRIPYAVAWVEFEDKQLTEQIIEAMQDLEIPELRTAFSWADWERRDGKAWFDWFVGKFRDAHIELMPCLFYTPVEKSGGRGTSYPPVRLADFADFTRTMIKRYGDAFTWLQFWNEPNWNVYWNWSADPEWKLFAEMVSGAMDVAKAFDKKIALGGLSPYDPEWVGAMAHYGILKHADALGIHAFPGTWDFEPDRSRGREWKGLTAEVELVRKQLRKFRSRAEVWITETGYSTYGEGSAERQREQNQIAYFEEVRACPADRVYWHTIVDQKETTPTDNELNANMAKDPRAYHFGIMTVDGRLKPLYLHWRGL